MSQLRLDPLSGKWVVITSARAQRPHAFLERTPATEADCPFCLNSPTPFDSAIETRDGGSLGPSRLLPNLYPAFEDDGPLQSVSLGPMFLEAPATGSHEVLVFTSDHHATLADLPETTVTRVLQFLRDRISQHERMPNFRYSQAIVNHGREAGASVRHPHAQLLAIPFVPREILDEQAGFARFEGNCLLCATADAESWDKLRIVATHENAVAFCPFWSGTPYEILIVPRHHDSHVHKAGEAAIRATGALLSASLQALRQVNGDVPYNIVLHTAPFRSTSTFHWHVHVYPKMTTRAGFEMGTGVPINIIAPETAATALRSAIS